jgi:UPF0716 family protein affecting phage T7 exclusion
VSSADLDWVGAAPLDAAGMKRLQRDLILQRTVLWVPVGLIISIAALFFLKLDISSPISIAILSLTLLMGLALGRISGNRRFEQIRAALIEGLNVTPLLHQEGKGIAARVLGMPGGADILDVLMRPTDGGALSKERDEWGRVVYKTRGADPKGPAEGSGADTIDATMPRVDAMTPRPEFEGLEGDLTEGEKLLEEANEARNEKAHDAWQKSESTDSELIEAGVEKLGDLVAQGHDFGEGGDFPQAPKRDSPNTPLPSQAENDEDSSRD